MTDEQPTEMALIESLREAPPKVTVARAAKRARMHESRWRQLAKGYQQVTADTRAPTKAPASTLARMARAVGATPDQLRSVGREDAAKALESLPARPDPDRAEHLLNMAVIDALKQMNVITNLALEQQDMQALTTSTKVAVELAELLQEPKEEASFDEPQSALDEVAAAAALAAQRVPLEEPKHGGHESV